MSTAVLLQTSSIQNRRMSTCSFNKKSKYSLIWDLTENKEGSWCNRNSDFFQSGIRCIVGLRLNGPNLNLGIL
jgi:hypothetical protein